MWQRAGPTVQRIDAIDGFRKVQRLWVVGRMQGQRRLAVVDRDIWAAANPPAGTANYLAAKAPAETWLLAVGDAMKKGAGRVHVERVMALYSDADVAAEPERDFSRHTHVRDLGRTLAGLFG